MSAMGSLRKPFDRIIVGIIALLLLIAAALVYFSWTHVHERALVATDDLLEDRIRSNTAELDGWFGAWHNALELEADHILTHDSIRTEELIDRWRTELGTHWPITAIRLADEDGSELALVRNDSLVQTSWHLPTAASRPTLTDTTSPPVDTARTGGSGPTDPRMTTWFSQALQNRTVDPTWSMSDSTGELYVSQLLRPQSDSLPYRVLQITIDPKRSADVIAGHGRDDMPAALLALPGGLTIPLMRSTTHGDSLQLPELVMAQWQANPSDRPYDLLGANIKLRYRFQVYPLNGLPANLGTMVYAGPAYDASYRARMLVIFAGALVLLFAVVLFIAYRRKQVDLERLRAQEESAHAQQDQLSKALGEREVLDREVHHRVKNNLQVVSSLLNLQATKLDDGPVKDEFLRGKQRIDMMALVHHKLYGLPDLRGIDLQRLFNDLVLSLQTVHEPKSRTVSCAVETSGIKADTDTAIELGIILCELVSNCYRHAFPYATGGHIDVNVQLVDRDLHRLIVKDNGRGLQRERGKASLGLEIVEALAGQLDGSFHVRSNGGVTFEVLFRMDPQPVQQ